MQVTMSNGLGGELLGRTQLIVDLQLALVRMQPRHFDHRRRQIDRADVRAVAREALRQQTAAAADVEQPPLRQRAALRHVADALRVERVQRFERAARVPEFVRQRIEFAYFRVHGAGRCGAVHGAQYSRGRWCIVL
jgi:hypothetical protein